jgi:hypothetical protein
LPASDGDLPKVHVRSLLPKLAEVFEPIALAQGRSVQAAKAFKLLPTEIGLEVIIRVGQKIIVGLRLDSLNHLDQDAFHPGWRDGCGQGGLSRSKRQAKRADG